MSELIYKELCYKMVGFAYEIYNVLGSDLKEKVYSDSLEEILKQENIPHKREVYFPLKIRDKTVGRRYFDFVIEDKLIIEIKSGSKNYKETCNQLYEYLRINNLKLGLIIRFTRDGVKVKRIPNLY